jgi:hypothetical protein
MRRTRSQEVVVGGFCGHLLEEHPCGEVLLTPVDHAPPLSRPKEVIMKKTALLATILVLALTMTASAQKTILFQGLPDTGTPSSMPLAYDGLNWTGIAYVDALKYVWANGTNAYGPGFFSGPHVMLAFGGGPLCFPEYGGTTIANICETRILANGVGTGAISSFQPISATVAAGWQDSFSPDSIVVTAYLNGNQVGSQKYNLSTTSQVINFPSWGPITELVIHPSPGAAFVLYSLTMN